MHNLELQKALLLLIPLLTWTLMIVRGEYTVREHSGAFLAFVWQFQIGIILNIFLIAAGTWVFQSTRENLYGVPIDVLLGQAILTGPVLFLSLRTWPFIIKLFISVTAINIIFAYSSLTIPTSYWLLGISFLVFIDILPSLLLAQWTADDSHIYLRSSLQAFGWVVLLLWLFPATIFVNTNHNWAPLLQRPLLLNLLYALPALIPATLLISALKQFAIEGDGTAFPYDPPKRLVTQGVYAYISNPMQLGICLLMAWWGMMTQCILLALSSIVALFLFVVFKDICNGSCAIGEDDPNWTIYQQEVPKWIPRRTPWRL